jgi:hypothetical protein
MAELFRSRAGLRKACAPLICRARTSISVIYVINPATYGISRRRRSDHDCSLTGIAVAAVALRPHAFETSWWKVVRWEHQRPRSGSNFSEDPGLTGIDTFQHSDNNWWCAWQVERHETALDRLLYRTFFSGPAEDEEDFDPVAVAGARRTLAPLLETSWLWKAQAPGEARSLSAIPPAPKSLGERAIAWARDGGKGAGQDEALALTVRATRYGCQRQGKRGAYSRAAFELLHKRFPASDAARRTRYWFE